MKVYVASTLSNYHRVRNIYTWLREHGIEVSFDWTDFAEEIIHLPPDKIELSSDELRRRGQLEIDGVDQCDLLLLVEPANKGSYTEFGYAKAQRKPIVVLNDEQISRPVSFHYLEDVFMYKNEADALNQILYFAENI